ncbi:hypothetical protein ABDK56_05910 [Sphingomonas sp. ASV193]|uniref:WD40/YVTN/BNR-like repeat-containing protein n=1 Tax=Sphingomonas sp. ASV193 TaxID=3144405 RepID=UPI0032E8D26C
MPIRPRLLLASVAALAALAPAAVAAPVDPAQFKALEWRSVGPFRGGRVLAVAGDPTDPRRFYFGSVNGGVWETNDAGRTWQPIFDQVPVGSIGALALAPSDPKILYVGTGEADMRSDIAQGTGLYRSADRGRTWQSIGLKDTQSIGRILVDPRNPDTLLVAALGHPYGPNPERGVFRSTDGGRSWTKTLYKDADTGAIDLAFEPGNASVVYAALWQTRRPPWNTYPPSYGPGSGLYKSLDGGRTWKPLTGRGLPANPARIGLSTSKAKPNRVYALIDSAKEEQAGLYRSDDRGDSWRRMTGDKRITNRGWYFGEVDADPNNADRLWVNNTIILRSDDGGAHFIPLKGDPTGDDFHTMWIDPKNSARTVIGVDQGTLVTLNGGKTWSSWFNQPTGQFYHVATDNAFPYRIYGAQQDSGAASVASRNDSHFDGIGMGDFHEVTAGGESDNIAPDPDDPDIVYGGRVDRLDRKSGQTRNVDPTLAYPGDYRRTWTLPLTWSKREHVLFFANQRIFQTADGGLHWTPISPDLTRDTLTVPPTLDPVTAKDTAVEGPRRGVVYDIGSSPLKDGLIWAGTDDGLIWRTDDHGGHWTNVTPAQITPWSKVGTIEPSHFDANTAYAAIDRHRLDDSRPYLYRTRDGGRSWQPIVAGLPVEGGLNSVNVIREDPGQRGLLFTGTERGLYVSFDDGDHWQPLQAGLPTTSVRDLTVHGNDLVIATHGRGFYVMDDIVPLRALALNAAAGTRLYPVAPAFRVNEPGFTGTPMPKDEPMAPNPPLGATIDYTLAQQARGPVTVRIFDAKGALVSTSSSADPVKPIDLATLPIAPEWVVLPSRPGTGAGHNRFVWDVHYDAPKSMKGRGVWAPPGRYVAEVDVDGQQFRQPLDIRPDPRVTVSQAEFDAQFALARQVEAQRVRAHALLDDAAALAKTLKGPRADQLAALVGRPPAATGTSDAASLLGIADRLDTLGSAVESADGGPSPDAVTGFNLLSQQLAALDQRYQAFKASLR